MDAVKRTGTISIDDLEFTSLKREAIYFDQLTFFWIDDHWSDDYLLDRQSISFLEAKRIVNPFRVTAKETETPSQEDFDNLRARGIKIHQVRKYAEIDAPNIYKDFKRYPRRAFRRLLAFILKDILGDNANVIPAFSNENSLSLEFEPSEGENKCLSVVLRALPNPDEINVSWSQIIDLKFDEEGNLKRRALFNWQNDIERQNLKPYEIAEKLATLIDDYNRHMKLQRFKCEAGTIETILTLSADVIESLLRLRLSKAVSALFSFGKREIALKEAEINAPGREVAFISHAHNKFG